MPKDNSESRVNEGSTSSNEPTTGPTSTTAPSRDIQGKNNNRVDDINLFYLKNSFDVLNEQDLVLEHVIGTTCTLEDISSSSQAPSPSIMKSTPNPVVMVKGRATHFLK